MKKNNFIYTLSFLIFLFSLTSCENEDNYYYTYNPNSAFGIIANASPSSGDLFFYADNNAINNSGLNYTDANGYNNFYTGNRVLTLKNSNGNAITSTNINLHQGDFFSVFAVNTFDKIELISYNDKLKLPSSANKSMIRFINLSPDAPAINILNNSTFLGTNLPFKTASDFIELESGSKQIIINSSTTGNQLLNTSIELKQGRIYTFYTKGFINPPPSSNDNFSLEKIQNN